MRASRRSRLAAPFVVTVALTACAADPPGNPPPRLTANPPPPDVVPRPEPTAEQPREIHMNPPHPQHPIAELPLPTNPASVVKGADGTCTEYTHVSCPPGVMCNPPPPHAVRCP